MTKDEAIKVLENTPIAPTYGYSFNDISDALYMAVDALQTDIVHCKECKHWSNLWEGSCEHPAAEVGDTLDTDSDDYCSYGERRNQ